MFLRAYLLAINFRFVPAQFENMFSKYARTVPDKFTLWELWKMTDDNGDMYDFIGRFDSNLSQATWRSNFFGPI